MLTKEDILRSIKASKAQLDSSISALSRKDEDSFADSLWYAAGELEYALFLFAMRFQDRDDTSEWEPKAAVGGNEAASLLRAALALLEESERALAEETLLDAYKSAYVARYYLFWVQEDLEKRRRRASKK